MPGRRGRRADAGRGCWTSGESGGGGTRGVREEKDTEPGAKRQADWPAARRRGTSPAGSSHRRTSLP
eukprot:7594339-Pyramimonas_sp.AAC.1